MRDSLQPHRCNDCGYSLEGLAPSDECPECGRPVARSLPDARIGSAWQRSLRPGQAVVEALARPGEMWEQVRPERAARSLVLLAFVCLACGLAMAVSLLVGGPQTGGGNPGYALVFALASGAVLMALSLTEACGLWLIGWRRGWSHSPGHLMAIVAHASPGWLTGALSCAVLWQVLQWVPAAWRVRGFDVFSLVRVPDGWIVGLVLVLGGGLGLMWFESLAYLGMTRLRYTSVTTESRGDRR
ncbi:MAG: hypothetical protein Tsb0013_08930 [Phycisphaerales bacterium]